MGSIKQAGEFYDGVMKILVESKIPALVDADALAPMYQAVLTQSLEGNQLVFTPHPKEFLKMTKITQLMDENKDVLNACKKAKQVIVYKTNASIVANEDGIWRSITEPAPNFTFLPI